MNRRIGIFLLASLALLGCKDRGIETKKGGEGPEQEKSGPKIEYYTCSMHPFIRQEGPGNCPICGMKLVPVYAQPAGPDMTGRMTTARKAKPCLRKAAAPSSSTRPNAS